MITQWDVLQYVADRHGKLEPIFEESIKKLELVRTGAIPLIDLEDNLARIKLRLARENLPVTIALERINGVNNFQDKYVLDKLSERAKAVCRILKRGAPIGTGFLVAENIIITNNHVIEGSVEANDMIAEFNYELDSDQLPKRSACFKFKASQFFLTSSLEAKPDIQYSGLDFTLIALESIGTQGERLNQYPPIYLDGNQGKIIKGESCIIIQHPQGLPKKVVLKDIAFFSETNTCILYESDTLPGSSGSMVIGLGTCEIIALHHSGLPKTDDKNQILTKKGLVATPGTPDDEIDWIGNEGIKISKIVEALKQSQLPVNMEDGRIALLRKTKEVTGELNSSIGGNNAPTVNIPLRSELTPIQLNSPSSKKMERPSSDQSVSADFLITAVYNSEIIERIESVLQIRYNQEIKLVLSMPTSADENEIELFYFTVPFLGNVNEEANDLIKIPEILNAEADIPIRINAGPESMIDFKLDLTESAFINDGLGEWNEDRFLKSYENSKYLDKNNLHKCREWNWYATGFDKIRNNLNIPSPVTMGVRIVQFDTGFTDHPKVEGGFDLDKDFNFLFNTDNANDLGTIGLGKHPGHGTRTGSLLIGNSDLFIEHDGNSGLLSNLEFKLVPYRIAESVILINRQKQLAAALDTAISEGFDIITMSMGLPPTISNARMAKKAYDKGIIWCCAAGNEVQAVVAPAVYPGTIAVAGTNPLDKDWRGSSRGDTVDIAAPGEDVYVPIWNKHRAVDFAYGNGTSYATPHVAAAAAYWLAKYKDELNSQEYAGWKKVEAFRQALYSSARKPDGFPSDLGKGILNVEELMNTAPVKASELNYGYNKWNENAFLASLQGYGELLKTYWNNLHGWIYGGEESIQSFKRMTSLSQTSQLLEQAVFNDSRHKAESTAGVVSDFDRFQIIYSIVQKSRKKRYEQAV